MKMKHLNDLPQECLSTILSLSSPRDACRAAAACSELRQSAGSDFVWESFLPHDYHDTLSRADSSSLANVRSKKEVFLLLCNSLLIDGGTKMFVLNRKSGLISYVLSARELSIAWASDPLYWSWKNVPISRFKETAELRNTSWLEIHGKINTKILSPTTTYGAYLIFNISKRAYGLETMPMEISIHVGNTLVCHNTVHLRKHEGNKEHTQWLLYYNRKELATSRVDHGVEGLVPVAPGSRDDGWMEIEVGQFYNGEHSCSEDDGKVVKMSLLETQGHHLKGGLIIEGIEIRPSIQLFEF